MVVNIRVPFWVLILILILILIIIHGHLSVREADQTSLVALWPISELT